MPRKKKEIVITSPGLEKSLIENLVQLQKINADMADKFDVLSKQMSELLNIFEKAAQNFVHTPELKVAERDKEFLDKIDKLIEQNKTIAKSIVLIDDKVKQIQNQPEKPVPRITRTVAPSTEEVDDDMPRTSTVSKPLPKI